SRQNSSQQILNGLKRHQIVLTTQHYKKTSTQKHKQSQTDRRVVYFSGKMLSSEDLRSEQEYFRDRKDPKSTITDRPLYVIELSCHPKYIGKTEKNLDAVFKKIKDMNGIIFFDEADALFGKRNEIKDTHGRYANIETSYLLERIQKYDGVVLVTPNHRKPITKQGINRLDYVICLPTKKQK
ncbi:MAG: ATP-binding protein, partial [Nitrosopumilus sp.]|nr:ATP-binding protein [Nitrosopumilus sp.]